MSYSKVILILVNLISTEVTMTPPNPSPKVHEAVKYEGSDVLFSPLYFKVIPAAYRASFLAAELCEIGLIVASHFPDNRVLQRLTSLLPNPSGVSSIRITRSYLFGTACMIAAGLIRRSAYRALGRMFTFQLTIRDDHKLVTDGPYAYVRHPSYSALILHFFGTVFTCIASGTFVNTCGITDISLWRRIIYGGVISVGIHCLKVVARVNAEDKVLKEKFTEEWKKWSKMVPYKLIPYVF